MPISSFGRRPSLIAIGFALFFSALAAAESFTERDRDALWKELRVQLRSHPRLVYHNGVKELPQYPSFVISNEVGFPTMKPPQETGDMQVGFATTTNYNILVARKNRSFVVADQSEEAVITMMSFYRPLFLLSPTPEAWLANIAGMDLEPGDTVDTIFERIGHGKKGTLEAVKAIGRRLQKMVDEGKISSADRRFTLAVLRDTVDPLGPNIPPDVLALMEMFGQKIPMSDRVPVYRNTKVTEIPLMMGLMYAPDGRLAFKGQKPSDPAIAKEELLMERFSFLRPEGYGHVRKVLQDGQDLYAQTRMEDPKFWAAVADEAKQRKQKVTDVYLSNIPSLIRMSSLSFDYFLNHQLAGLATDGKIAVYEAALEAPHDFRTTVSGREDFLLNARAAGGGHVHVDMSESNVGLVACLMRIRRLGGR